MTNIDWAQPVETCEDPPRPVRVLATDLDTSSWPVAVAIPCTDEGDMEVMCFSHDGTACADNIRFTIRNVAPPKPEPVLRERWVVWDAKGGCVGINMSKESAQRTASSVNGVYARAAVMSDGSPVPGEGVGDPVKELIRWKQEYKCWKAKAEALQAEVDRMRPVVEAAVIYCTTGQDRGGEKLLTAVEQYIAWEKRND